MGRRSSSAKAVAEEPAEEEFEVEDILVCRRAGATKFEFFVKWKGYSESENTWEPEKHVNELSGPLKQKLAKLRKEFIAAEKPQQPEKVNSSKRASTPSGAAGGSATAAGGRRKSMETSDVVPSSAAPKSDSGSEQTGAPPPAAKKSRKSSSQTKEDAEGSSGSATGGAAAEAAEGESRRRGRAKKVRTSEAGGVAAEKEVPNSADGAAEEQRSDAVGDSVPLSPLSAGGDKAAARAMGVGTSASESCATGPTPVTESASADAAVEVTGITKKEGVPVVLIRQSGSNKRRPVSLVEARHTCPQALLDFLLARLQFPESRQPA